MDTTEQFVAWWGAIIATSVLIWDVLKWINSGPKIKNRVVLQTHYHDGKIIKKEDTESGQVSVYEEYCHIELVNTGSVPTTVMGISLTHKRKKKQAHLTTMSQAFTEHFGKQLPCVIASGEVWSCRLPMDYYYKMIDMGVPEFHVNLSHKKKPLVIRATKPANKSLTPKPYSA
jgi:hypothetical protein